MIRVTVNTEGPRTTMRLMGERAADLTPVWRSVAEYLVGKANEMFDRCGSGSLGGTHRGVTWAPFADQYTRKTDGVTVPAYGGVPRLRARRAGTSTGSRRTGAGSVTARGILRDLGRWRGTSTGSRGAGAGSVTGSATASGGMVLGRLRPSGTRVTTNSKLMQDTGRMRREIGSNRVMTPRSLVMSCPTDYAGKQQQMRPFFFANDDDAAWIGAEAERFVRGARADTQVRPYEAGGPDTLLGRIRARGE